MSSTVERPQPIRVFLSYAQQSGDHPRKARQLADSLRQAGLLSIIDQYESAPKQGWRAWMEGQIRDADWILVVCSEAYFERVSGTGPEGRGRGVIFEASLMLNELYAASMINERFVPVIFDRDDSCFIPVALQAYQRYLWEQDHDDLLRHLTRQPKVVPPPVAPQVVVLEPEPAPSFDLEPPGLDAETPNPFTDTGPVRDEARFIGRQSEVDRLRAMLKNGSVNLWGEPKIGKSSLLLRAGSFWDGEVLGPFDCHNLLTRSELYERLGAALGVGSDRRAVRDALSEGRRLLILDELDAAPSRGLDLTDLQVWRSIETHNPGFHLLVASRLQIKYIFPDDGRSGSPAFNLTLPMKLGPLEAEPARALLRPPWTDHAVFTSQQEQEVATDLSRAGCEGRPFWIQRAAHHRFEALRCSDYRWTDAWRGERSALT